MEKQKQTAEVKAAEQQNQNPGAEQHVTTRPPVAEQETDVNSVFADIQRRAHDKELEAIANLAIFRSSFEKDNLLSPQDQQKRELDQRLYRIISDLSDDP